MTLRVLSLFSGIGSPEKALTNLGVDYELVGFSEIDITASKAYSAIHNVDAFLNLGDITKVDFDKLPDNIDLITHGSPCQDVSKEGKNKGADKGSGTRSSLMWNTLEIVSLKKPSYVIWENVPNYLSKKHRHNFDKYLSDLEQLGYVNYTKPLLNAINYEIPQNRERIYVVSIHKSIDDGNFKIPEGSPLTTRLIDLMEDNVDEKYFLSEEKQNELIHHIDGDQIYIVNATKQGFLPVNNGDGVDFAFPNSKTRRGRVQPQRSHTLLRGGNIGILLDGRLKRFTPLESYRLMGFDDTDYMKAVESGSEAKDIYSQAGNSIVVNVMEAIFKELFKLN